MTIYETLVNVYVISIHSRTNVTASYTSNQNGGNKVSKFEIKMHPIQN
jgi:hypothetical protein